MSQEFFHFYRGAPEKVRVNLGAFQLLKELYRVLKPEGLAVITEFGYQDRLPFRAGHLDHAEYSIQFGQAVSVAAALGFNLYLTDIFDFLGFRTRRQAHDTLFLSISPQDSGATPEPPPKHHLHRGIVQKTAGKKSRKLQGDDICRAR